jgi:hypothetical protein
MGMIVPGGITGGPCGGRGAGSGLCIGIREFDGIQDDWWNVHWHRRACSIRRHELLALSVRSEASTTLSAICASFSASVSRHITILGGGHPSSSKAHTMFQLDVILVIRSIPVPLKVEAAAAAWHSRSR